MTVSCGVAISPLLPQRGDDLGRQEVRVDDHVPRAPLQQPEELPQVELLDQQPQAVALALRRGRRGRAGRRSTRDVRRLVDQVEIRPAVEPAEGGVGEVQHVEVLDGRRGIELPQGHFDGLGRAEMAGADRGREDEDALHGREVLGLRF